MCTDSRSSKFSSKTSSSPAPECQLLRGGQPHDAAAHHGEVEPVGFGRGGGRDRGRGREPGGLGPGPEAAPPVPARQAPYPSRGHPHDRVFQQALGTVDSSSPCSLSEGEDFSFGPNRFACPPGSPGGLDSPGFPRRRRAGFCFC